jgi:hypothetical protein
MQELSHNQIALDGALVAESFPGGPESRFVHCDAGCSPRSEHGLDRIPPEISPPDIARRQEDERRNLVSLQRRQGFMEDVGIAVVEGHENLNAWSPRSDRKRSGPRIDDLEVPGQNLEVGCKILR